MGPDAWSSKHIVDMLCPPLEETGNPVQCYPVENYPLGVVASWEPTQEGSGEPSPENVRPIKGRDSVTVTRCGGNLLNIKTFNKSTKDGITYEYVPDGGIHISGTALTNVTSPMLSVSYLSPGKYYGADSGEGIGASIVVHRNGKNVWLNVKGTFVILAGDVIKFWCLSVNGGATVDKTLYPYIVPGTTAPTTYAPYTGQTTALTLPSTVYGGTVDAVSGVGKEVWRSITLDGVSEKFVNEYDDYWNLLPMNTPGISNQNIDYIVSSHFYHAFGGNITGFLFTTSSMMKRYFATPDELNAYIAAQYAAGTPVQIAYKLTTPTPFTATGAQPIPALPGVNTVLTDADSVTVTGRADPIKRITDLEDAVASMTNT